jgi:recombination protein RecR
MILPKPVQNLIDSFESLPGVGPKTAQRLAFYLLRVPQEDLDHFASSLGNLKKLTKSCAICGNIDEASPCKICGDQTRDQDIICVVATPLDVLALEKTGYRGLYHVLGGVIDPLNRVGPDELRIDDLIKRLNDKWLMVNDRSEVILATSPTMEGEATALYIQRLLKDKSVKLTRIGRGLPIGSDVEYADESTLQRALEGRMEF